MKIRDLRVGAFAVALLSATGIFPLSAQLPSLTDKDSLGYFVTAKSRSFEFGITSGGKTTIKVLDSKGAPVGHELTIPIVFTVEETTPNGKIVSRQIVPESLESTHPATAKPKDLSFKGKVTGDIGFEVFVSEERGSIMLGGHLLDPAAMKNPTRFAIHMKIPVSKPKAKANSEDDKKAAKELAEKIKDDKVNLVWTDGKKTKIAGDEAVEGSSKEVSGPGISAATIDFAAFKERKIQVTATPNSSMLLSNSSKQPLVDGFSLTWSADPAKDPQAKARLAIEIK